MAQPTTAHTETLHASCVALAGQGVLILGASGAGKSGLALQLMALGAELVADDRSILTEQNGQIIAASAPPIQAQIEARFVGILSAPYAGPTPVRLIVDLDQIETQRLPPQYSRTILGQRLPLIKRSDAPHFAAAICAWLKGERVA